MKRSLLFYAVVLCMPAWSDPVWHCSRNTADSTQTISAAQESQFSIASLNASAEVIAVSINDLIDVYSGVPVRLGGAPLSACFMPSNQELTSSALTSLGLQTPTTQALARKSSIIQSHLFFVTNEKQMMACISKNYPAVGYLQEPANTNDVSPCF
jgi:hypothetical protein